MKTYSECSMVFFVGDETYTICCHDNGIKVHRSGDKLFHFISVTDLHKYLEEELKRKRETCQNRVADCDKGTCDDCLEYTQVDISDCVQSYDL